MLSIWGGVIYFKTILCIFEHCCCCSVFNTSVVSNSVRPQRQQPTRLPRPWDSPGKNTGVGCHFLLQCMKVKLLSPVLLLATPGTAAYQAPPSMGFARQEYWSGLPLPSPNWTLMWCNTYHLMQRFNCTWCFSPVKTNVIDRASPNSSPPPPWYHWHHFTLPLGGQTLAVNQVSNPSSAMPSVWHWGMCLTSPCLSYLQGEKMSISGPVSLSHYCVEWLTYVKYSDFSIHSKCSINWSHNY